METLLNGCSDPNLNREGFRYLAERQREPCIIPLFIRVPVPSFSPVELYRSLVGKAPEEKGEPSSGFLLESMDGDRKIATYSFFGTDPVLRVTCYHDDDAEVSGDPGLLGNIRVSKERDPIETIKSLINAFNVVPSPVPRFSGGLVGYFSYDLVYSLLPVSAQVRHKSKITDPIAEFMLCLDCMVLDHYRSDLWIVRNVMTGNGRSPDELFTENLAALMKRYDLVRKFLEPNPSPGVEQPKNNAVAGKVQAGSGSPRIARIQEPDTSNAANCCTIVTPGPIDPEAGKDLFTFSVRHVRDLIHSGEVVQAVISRKEEYTFRDNPLVLYQALRNVNPSPYMYYLDFSDYSVVGASPEMLVRVEGRTVTTVPIAGTRKRGINEEEDKLLEQELLLDQKERAEHVMLVDLARNDIGSVCTFGSVRVPRFMQVGKYSHVQHIVSTVTGKIAKNYDRFDVFRACFPAGTVSGAPKIRAIEIIDEQEPGPRGLYAGAVGYIGFDGGLEFAIAIRTAIVKDGTASVQAGAGIVADSDPDREWIETNQKLAAMKQAVKLAGGTI